MLKSEYVELHSSKPWKVIEDHFDNVPVADIKPIAHLDIETDKWIQFSVDNFDLAQQKYESVDYHYSEMNYKFSKINNQMGRNEHNTFELNYGINGDTQEKLRSLFGDENVKKLKADPETVLLRLLVKMPGHGIAWHHDDLGNYGKKFPDVDHTKLKRLWFSIQDWKDGHAFQISKTMLSHWKAGDVYHIPFGQGHASSNFGYCPQYTVSFTGIIND